MIFDTHCHLFDEQFKDELDEVINRAKISGVKKMLVLGDNINNSISSINIADKYEGVYSAIGIFPCECYDLNLNDSIDCLKKLFKTSKKIKAIGEIGLDYYWEKNKEKRNKQKDFFIAQLMLANELDLPVSIHARDSIEDVYNVLKEYFPKKGVIMHCFSSSVEMMKKFINLGCYISLGGPITFKNAITPKEIAINVPINRLIIETDSPYLAPHPLRGKRNEPAFIKYVLNEISILKNIPIEELENIIYDNSCNILGVKK